MSTRWKGGLVAPPLDVLSHMQLVNIPFQDSTIRALVRVMSMLASNLNGFIILRRLRVSYEVIPERRALVGSNIAWNHASRKCPACVLEIGVSPLVEK
jgi:hypothetical protein